jgi:hypothetical protein
VLFTKAIAGLAGTTLVACALVMHEGVISVNVREKHRDGNHVRFFVPATVVGLGMAVAPKERIEHATRHARKYLPIARIGAEELAKCPDFVLVEVHDRDEHVRIQKLGGRILVDVDSAREEVHVAVPIRTIISALRDLEAAGTKE